MDFKTLKEQTELDFGLLIDGEVRREFDFKKPTQRIKLAIGEAKAQLKDTPGRLVIEALRLALTRLCGRDLGLMPSTEATELIARLKYPDVMLLLYRRYFVRKKGITKIPSLACPACGKQIVNPELAIGEMPVYPGKDEKKKVALSVPIQVGTMEYSELTISVPSWRESVMGMPLKTWNNWGAWRWAVAKAAIAEPIPEAMLLDMDEEDAAAIDAAIDGMSGGVVPVAKYLHTECGNEIGVTLDWTDSDFV